MDYKVVIDSDSILYTACYNNQTELDGKFAGCNLELAYMDFVTKVSRIKSMVFNKHKEDYIDRVYRGRNIYKLNIDFEIIFSPKHTFRHDLTDSYKSNRKGTDIVGIPELKQMVTDRLGSTQVPLMEADDIVISKAYEEDNIYIACIDKDIYTHSPVDCINYNTWEWTKALDEETIEEQYWIQALMGDSTDGIKGAKGIGKTTAPLIVMNPIDLFSYEKYVSYFDSEEDAVLSMRLVRLDQYKKGKLELWTN